MAKGGAWPRRTRRPSSPKGEYTPPAHVRKKLYRLACRQRANDGRMNDAGTGQWVMASGSKAHTFAKNGGMLRGGATRGGPTPKFMIYEKKLTEVKE